MKEKIYFSEHTRDGGSHKPRLRAHNNTFPPGLVIENAISPGSGLVIDFATSPVRTGNSFFGGSTCSTAAVGEVRGGKMRGTGARYQYEAMGNLRGWNVRGAKDNWRNRCRCRM